MFLKGERRGKRISTRGGAAAISRALKGALAILLAATLVPLIPGTPGAEEAEEAWAVDSGFAGTTDYAQLFTWGNRFGSPSRQPDSSGRLRAASTEVRASNATSTHPGTGGDWGYASADATRGGNGSSSTYITKQPISLANSWSVSFESEVGICSLVSGIKSVEAYAFLCLSTTSDPLTVTGPAFLFRRLNDGSPAYTQILQRHNSLNGALSATSAGSVSVPVGQVPITFSGTGKVSATVSYDSTTDTLTANAGGVEGKITEVKKVLSKSSINKAYLAIGGLIGWTTPSNAYHEPPSRNLNVAVTFKSFTLPHLSPTIEGLTLYRGKTSQAIGKDDAVQPGEVVRIECTVRNAHPQAASEYFPMHLKTISTEKFPTRGLTFLRDSTYPVSVDGVPATVSIDSAAGVPLALVGGTAVKVVYYARVSGAAGGAVSIGQQLIEDSFGGTREAGALLVNERSLEAAPGTVDPDNPGTGAGHDFHYARFPQPNANGWNNSPVTVRFYPGDFDQMTLTPAGGSAVTLTGASPDWVQATDTAKTTLSAQAKNTITDAISTQKAGSVKIDTTAPRLTYRAVVGQLDIDDSAAVVSGVWKLHRTDATGTVARASSVAHTFALSAAGDGASTQTVTAPAPGWYVAEDAAGNLSAPLQVPAADPPAATRPDPAGPDAPEAAGPPLDPSTPVPDPTTTEGDDGLKHAVINETISEMIDPSAPPFGGALDLATAKKIIAYRYNLASNAPGTGTLTETTELLDGAGNPLSAFDTTTPGACLIRHVATDAQGNTTTINLTYQLTRDSCPPVRPIQPVDPTDPSGPTQPGEALTPDGPVITHPDGTQHTEVSCEITEAVTRGTMDAADAEALLRRHFAVADVDGGDAAITVQSMKNAAGDLLSTIDLSRAADYRITYLVSDAAGNTTAVKLTYHLVSSHVPGVVKHPEPGDSADLLPGDDPLNPRPRPLDPAFPPQVAVDGTQHAVAEDVIRVPAQEGTALSPADARSLMQRRYTFTPEGGGAVTELSLVLADGDGTLVPSIDRSRPGAWTITYKVADASGNTITVRLRYLVVADAPSVTPQPDPDESKPGGEAPGGREPLPPTQVDVDSDTGLTHAIIEDTVTVPTSDDPMTPTAMGDFLQARYNVKSALADGKLDRSPAHLYRDVDARNALALSLATSQPLGAVQAVVPGEEVDAIDRSVPGDWLAEQVLTDSAGDTTTIRLHYLVRESTADVSGGGNGQGAGNSNNASVSEAGPLPPSAESGSSRSWSSRIHELPQTGGIFGPCPLHVMFALLMLLASAYGLSRLRQIRAERRWEEGKAAIAC